MQVFASPLAHLAPEMTASVCRLLTSVWPDHGTAEVFESRLEAYRGDLDHHLHWVVDHGRVVGAARSFPHQIRSGGASRTVLALAAVCSDPACRGQGIGAQVVGSALERASSEMVCFFQTGVPDFYRRRGGRTVANAITTSVPGARTFWEPHAMIYPADAAWDDEAPIDLCGDAW